MWKRYLLYCGHVRILKTIIEHSVDSVDFLQEKTKTKLIAMPIESNENCYPHLCYIPFSLFISMYGIRINRYYNHVHMLYVRIHKRYRFEYLFSIVKMNNSSTFHSPTKTFIFSWQSWNNACACWATVSNWMSWISLLTWQTRLYKFPDNGIWALSQIIILLGPRRWHISYFRTVKQWNGLPDDAALAPSLDVFKHRVSQIQHLAWALTPRYPSLSLLSPSY